MKAKFDGDDMRNNTYYVHETNVTVTFVIISIMFNVMQTDKQILIQDNKYRTRH
jgi:hypothetical protein